MSNDSVKTYSADEQTLSIAGQAIDSGYADGEFVSIKRAAPIFTTKVGSDGEVARAKSNNKLLEIKIKLMQTSLGNDVLTQLALLAESGTNGADVGAFVLNDRSGGTTVRCDNAWVAGWPDVARARETGDAEWTLAGVASVFDVNGNPSV